MKTAKTTLTVDEQELQTLMDAAAEMLPKEDKVNHPSHYTFGEIEVIDYIRDKLTVEEFTGYCIGNVMKYISRWRYKDGQQDLKKAQVYLNWAIESADNEGDYAKRSAE